MWYILFVIYTFYDNWFNKIVQQVTWKTILDFLFFCLVLVLLFRVFLQSEFPTLCLRHACSSITEYGVFPDQAHKEAGTTAIRRDIEVGPMARFKSHSNPDCGRERWLLEQVKNRSLCFNLMQHIIQPYDIQKRLVFILRIIFWTKIPFIFLKVYFAH